MYKILFVIQFVVIVALSINYHVIDAVAKPSMAVNIVCAVGGLVFLGVLLIVDIIEKK